MSKINAVHIGTDEYARLLEAETAQRIIRSALFSGATLNYNGNDLDFDSMSMRGVVKALFPLEYAATIETAKRREGMNDE